MQTVTLTETGCYLDSHRGHYIQRDVIDIATGWGFIITLADEFVVRMYDNEYDLPEGVEYPHEIVTELCDAAIEWLNSGQTECENCDGSGVNPKDGDYWTHKDDPQNTPRCKRCTGTGRGDRIAGQNFPPHIPNGTMWSFNDGDFGCYHENEEELMP